VIVLSVAYQRWNLPPKFRHQMDVYQPPADPFDGLSSYRTAYNGRTAPMRPSMKPDDAAHLSAEPLDDVTTVRAAYVRHPLPDVAPKRKQMWLPNPAELDGLTNYRKEYTRKQQGRCSRPLCIHTGDTFAVLAIQMKMSKQMWGQYAQYLSMYTNLDCTN